MTDTPGSQKYAQVLFSMLPYKKGHYEENHFSLRYSNHIGIEACYLIATQPELAIVVKCPALRAQMLNDTGMS